MGPDLHQDDKKKSIKFPYQQYLILDSGLPVVASGMTNVKEHSPHNSDFFRPSTMLGAKKDQEIMNE